MRYTYFGLLFLCVFFQTSNAFALKIVSPTPIFTTDSDGDGLTNFAERNIYHSDPNDADSDDDGYPDGSEVRRGTNINDADTDDDGLLDGEEIRWDLDPKDPSDAGADQDGDGLTNSDEILVIHTNMWLIDTDYDTYGDGVEITEGTDPLDPLSHP